MLLVPTAIGLFSSNSTIAWLTLVCGAFVTMMSKFGSLAELTMGPMKVKMRETHHESLILQARLDAAVEALAETQAAAAKLPTDRTTADVITTTTNAAVEAVTAAMRANDVITLTTAEPGRTVTRDFPAAMETGWSSQLPPWRKRDPHVTREGA